MCFNYKVSLFTFLIGTIFSIILINFGDQKYALENKISGIFLIFISAIQFMDFLFWIDIKNKLGINKIREYPTGIAPWSERPLRSLWNGNMQEARWRRRGRYVEWRISSEKMPNFVNAAENLAM